MNVFVFDNLELSGRQREQFELLAARLTERNQQINLTAITDPDEIREKHFADSLAILQWEGFKDCRQILDLGTGGGFPGLPIKIARPEADVTMMDSVRKKLTFVEEMIGDLGLDGAGILWARAEEAAHDGEHRGAYDLVVSRAVAPLPTLIEYALPFLRVGGVFVAYKSGAESELADSARALAELGGTVETVIPYEIADGGKRALIVIRKTGATPDRYPRRTGKPVRAPLV